MNLHGAGLLLPPFVAAGVAGELLRRRLAGAEASGGPRAGALVGFAAASVLASAVHPQGIAIHRYALEASAFGRRWVSEWLPFTLEGGSGIVPLAARWTALLGFAGAGLLALALLVRLGARRGFLAVHPSRWLLLAGSAALAFRAMKFLWLGFFALDFALRAGRVLAGTKARGGALGWLAIPAAASLPFLHPGLAPLLATVPGGTYLRETVDPRSVPIAAARFVREAGLEGRLFNSYGWGGYLIHVLGPRLPVFVDGRMFEYGERVFRDGFAIRDWGKGLERAREAIARRGIELTIFERNWCPPGGCFGPEWTLVYRDVQAAVFVRAGSENEARARSRLDALGIGFPFTEFGAARGAMAWAREEGVLSDVDLDALARLFARDDLAARTQAAELFAKGGDLYLGSLEAALLRVLEAEPRHPEAHFNLGLARAKEGKFDAARESILRHLEIHPGDEEARSVLRRLEGPR